MPLTYDFIRHELYALPLRQKTWGLHTDSPATAANEFAETDQVGYARSTSRSGNDFNTQIPGRFSSTLTLAENIQFPVAQSEWTVRAVSRWGSNRILGYVEVDPPFTVGVNEYLVIPAGAITIEVDGVGSVVTGKGMFDLLYSTRSPIGVTNDSRYWALHSGEPTAQNEYTALVGRNYERTREMSYYGTRSVQYDDVAETVTERHTLPANNNQDRNGIPREGSLDQAQWNAPTHFGLWDLQGVNSGELIMSGEVSPAAPAPPANGWYQLSGGADHVIELVWTVS